MFFFPLRPRSFKRPFHALMDIIYNFRVIIKTHWLDRSRFWWHFAFLWPVEKNFRKSFHYTKGGLSLVESKAFATVWMFSSTLIWIFFSCFEWKCLKRFFPLFLLTNKKKYLILSLKAVMQNRSQFLFRKVKFWSIKCRKKEQLIRKISV